MYIYKRFEHKFYNLRGSHLKEKRSKEGIGGEERYEWMIERREGEGEKGGEGTKWS